MRSWGSASRRCVSCCACRRRWGGGKGGEGLGRWWGGGAGVVGWGGVLGG